MRTGCLKDEGKRVGDSAKLGEEKRAVEWEIEKDAAIFMGSAPLGFELERAGHVQKVQVVTFHCVYLISFFWLSAQSGKVYRKSSNINHRYSM